MTNIRQIADPILHRAPKLVDFANETDKTQLNHDLTILNNNLREQGGAGIAANQCAQIKAPLQMCIIGISDGRAREYAQQRYPSENIPHETLLVNPKILEYRGEAYFPSHGEGCLSVNGALRAKVLRYPEVVLEYYEQTGEYHKVTHQGFAAHVVQHETDHLHGIVYLQSVVDELSIEQRQTLLTSVTKALSAQQHVITEPSQAAPELIFDRQDGRVLINDDKLQQQLPLVVTETLQGFKSFLEMMLC